MRDTDQCDACGCMDEIACQNCRKQRRLKQDHARRLREKQAGGYDERNEI